MSRGRHLYSARRSSCWASAHILVLSAQHCFYLKLFYCFLYSFLHMLRPVHTHLCAVYCSPLSWQHQWTKKTHPQTNSQVGINPGIRKSQDFDDAVLGLKFAIWIVLISHCNTMIKTWCCYVQVTILPFMHTRMCTYTFVYLWSPYVIGRPYIFSCCFFFLLLSFFSSPNLSG